MAESLGDERCSGSACHLQNVDRLDAALDALGSATKQQIVIYTAPPLYKFEYKLVQRSRSVLW